MIGSRCLAFVLLAGSIAHAQDMVQNKAAAQSLFDEALTLMEQRRFVEACPKLAESERLDPGGGTVLNLGSCYESQLSIKREDDGVGAENLGKRPLIGPHGHEGASFTIAPAE